MRSPPPVTMAEHYGKEATLHPCVVTYLCSNYAQEEVGKLAICPWSFETVSIKVLGPSFPGDPWAGITKRS